MNKVMSTDASPDRGLPEDFFEMEIISNAGNSVELNEGDPDAD